MQLSDLKWTEARSLDKATPVVLPIAALEQHGLHLPLFTDSILLQEIVRRAETALSDRVLFGPLMWLGHSEHHLDFPGTLSVPAPLYVELLASLMDNLIRHGFHRIVLLNGHGGNILPGAQAVQAVRHRHAERKDLLLLSATYWSLIDPDSLADLETRQGQMGHACEWETAMMLHLRPDLVEGYESLAPVPQSMGFEPASQGWRTLDRSATGHIGQPATASAALGGRLLEAFGQGVIEFLSRVASFLPREETRS